MQVQLPGLGVQLGPQPAQRLAHCLCHPHPRDGQLPGIVLHLNCIVLLYCIALHWHCIVFQDWEDYIYIDPTVFGSAVMWLLNYQSEEGAFYETEYTERPLHYAMFSENRSHIQYYILELSNGTSRNFTVPGGCLY